MTVVFFIAAVVTLLATIAVVVSRNLVYALLGLVVSLFSMAVLYYSIGAPLAAGLEVIVYAGAIMVLFVFVVMMLNVGRESVAQERRWLAPRVWIGPVILAAFFLAELVYLLLVQPGTDGTPTAVASRSVGAALFGPFELAVEASSMLLLAALVGALHLARVEPGERQDDR